jgi:hypothetical protein
MGKMALKSTILFIYRLLDLLSVRNNFEGQLIYKAKRVGDNIDSGLYGEMLCVYAYSR